MLCSTSDTDNELLLRSFTDAEVLSAIVSLLKHKAAGHDGLNNDVYKDTAALMAPALVQISNQILQGGGVSLISYSTHYSTHGKRRLG